MKKFDMVLNELNLEYDDIFAIQYYGNDGYSFVCSEIKKVNIDMGVDSIFFEVPHCCSFTGKFNYSSRSFTTEKIATDEIIIMTDSNNNEIDFLLN